jgi:chromosome segregation ATPase
MSDPDKHYWSDEYVEKLHAEIATLREKVDSLRSESDGWQETARQFKLSYEAAEDRAQRAAKEMRERCAKVCETVAKGAHKEKRGGAVAQSIEQVIWTCEDLAKAIRALPINESATLVSQDSTVASSASEAAGILGLRTKGEESAPRVPAGNCNAETTASQVAGAHGAADQDRNQVTGYVCLKF